MKKILTTLFILVTINSAPAISAINTNAILNYNQGIDYYKTGQYDRAIAAFKDAINLDPNYIDAYYNLGSVYEYLGEYEAALAIFKQVIVRQPNDYDSVFKAAWLSYQLGQSDKAKTYLTIIPPNYPRIQEVNELKAKLKVSSSDAMPKPDVESFSSETTSIYENITSPTGITSDNEGNIYIAEFTNNSIIKITPQNEKIVFIKDAKISGHIGLACDNIGNLYIANYNKNNVLKVSAYGEIIPLINNVKKPYCLYLRGSLLYIACQGSNSVLKYKLKN